MVGKSAVNKVYDPACGSGSLLLNFVKVLGHDAVRQGFYKIDRYEGLIKTYVKPFNTSDHDALGSEDYVWAQFIENRIVPVGMK